MHRDPIEPTPGNANADGPPTRSATRTHSPDPADRVLPPVHAAIRGGKLGQIRHALVSTPNALHVCDWYGDPPLHFAIRSGAPAAILECLLEHGASLATRNMHGETAMHVAFGQHRVDPTLLSRLLSHADRMGDGGAWLAGFVPDANGRFAYERALNTQRQPLPGMAPVVATLQRHDAWYRAYLANMANAVTRGDRKELATLLACEMPLDLAIQGGKTALMVAAELGHEAVVDMLLAHADEHGMRQLNLTAADSGDTALMLAAFHGHVGVVDRLLATGAATEVPSPCGDTALMAAAIAGHDGIVERLLQAGARVDTRNALGRTALMFAAVAGHQATVEALLRHGAAVDAKDGEGRTALAFAALHAAAIDSGPSLQERVKAMRADAIGALPQATSTLRVSGHRQATGRGRHRDTAQVLLHHGASVNARDIRGATSLMHAAANGHIEILAVLLGAGANWQLRDNSGRTALTYATAAGQSHAARVLRSCQS